MLIPNEDNEKVACCGSLPRCAKRAKLLPANARGISRLTQGAIANLAGSGSDMEDIITLARI